MLLTDFTIVRIKGIFLVLLSFVSMLFTAVFLVVLFTDFYDGDTFFNELNYFRFAASLTVFVMAMVFLCDYSPNRQ